MQIIKGSFYHMTRIYDVMNRDRPIFGFYRYIDIGQNSRFYQPQ